MVSTSTNPSARWAALQEENISPDVIRSILQSVQDDLWVITACVDRLLDDTTTQKAMLEYGMARSAPAVNQCQIAIETPGPNDPTDDGDDDSEENFKQARLQSYFEANPQDARICQLRSILARRLEYLNTYVELCKVAAGKDSAEDTAETNDDAWDDDPWETTESSPDKVKSSLPFSLSTFLSEHVVSSACLLAIHQQFSELEVLFKRHTSTIWPFRLHVLNNTPEYSHPSRFIFILPSLNISTNLEAVPPSQLGLLEKDWVEDPTIYRIICASSPSLDIFTIEGECSADPLSSECLTEWYRRKAESVIEETGMIDVALSFIQHGVSQGITGLDELGEELSLLSKLVYDAPQPKDSTTSEEYTVSRWRSMDPATVVNAYLTHSKPDTIVKDIRCLVLPYLYVLEARAERSQAPDHKLAERLLYEFILSAPLSRVANILDSSKATMASSERIVRNDEDVVRLALSCLYGSNSLDEWRVMSTIFECMPAWNGLEADDDPAETTLSALTDFLVPSVKRTQIAPVELYEFFKPLPNSALSRLLDILEIQLESGEILARWDVPAPLKWFVRSQNDVNEQRACASKMARRAGTSRHRMDSQTDWEWLLDDMLKLCTVAENGLRGPFGMLSATEVISIFFAGVLSSGQFNIAQRLLNMNKSCTVLDSATLEDIYLKVSQEFYDNANSGNYNMGEMKLAYDCLRIAPQTMQVLKEREFIEATSKLASYNLQSRRGIPLNPIEIRQTKDRLSLVSQVLSSNTDAYKYTEVVMDLVHLLGYRNDIVAEVKVLAMIADTALSNEDMTRSYDTSEQMVKIVIRLRESEHDGNPLANSDAIREASDICWMSCYQLGRQPMFTDLDRKLSLLGRALEFCPADKLPDVLAAWKRIQVEDMNAREERLTAYHTEGLAAGRKLAASRQQGTVPGGGVKGSIYSLQSKSQSIHRHLPTSPLMNTPDPVAIASRTFKSVAATFPFSVGGRSDDGHSNPMSPSTKSEHVGEVSAQASKMLSKGIGWLIGADEEFP